jgi:hypothetical protein
MRQSAAVLCQDNSTLKTLKATLDELGFDLLPFSSQKKALESVLDGRCSTLIVDFDLPGADEVMRMAALLPPAQKPALIAVASRAWPGTGKAFQSGAGRILYRPLQIEQVKEALHTGKNPAKKAKRKVARYEMKTVVYLDVEGGTLSGISIDIGEHGLALQATEPVPMSSEVVFHCVLPGTDITLDGHADVIWASEHGRAGLFFSKLAPAARKHLKQWLHKRAAHDKHHDQDAVRALLPPAHEHVALAVQD